MDSWIKSQLFTLWQGELILVYRDIVKDAVVNNTKLNTNRPPETKGREMKHCHTITHIFDNIEVVVVNESGCVSKSPLASFKFFA